MQKYYPVYLNLNDKHCLVVGGGKVALRKVRTLLNCQSNVKLVALNIIPEIKNLKIKYKNFKYLKKSYNIKDLKEIFLVVVATNNIETNTKIAYDASKKGLLVNVVDNPNLCNFIVPSTFQQGDLSISISTGGISPALSKMIRQDLQKHFGGEYSVFLKTLKTFRQEIIKLPEKKKKLLWRKIVNPNVINKIRNKSKKEAEKLIRSIITLRGCK